MARSPKRSRADGIRRLSRGHKDFQAWSRSKSSSRAPARRRRYTDSLEDAKRVFATAWRAWLAKTNKDEGTYRPRYGSPVNPRIGRNALFLAPRHRAEPDTAQRNAVRFRICSIDGHRRADDACRRRGNR